MALTKFPIGHHWRIPFPVRFAEFPHNSSRKENNIARRERYNKIERPHDSFSLSASSLYLA